MQKKVSVLYGQSVGGLWQMRKYSPPYGRFASANRAANGNAPRLPSTNTSCTATICVGECAHRLWFGTGFAGFPFAPHNSRHGVDASVRVARWPSASAWNNPDANVLTTAATTKAFAASIPQILNNTPSRVPRRDRVVATPAPPPGPPHGASAQDGHPSPRSTCSFFSPVATFVSFPEVPSPPVLTATAPYLSPDSDADIARTRCPPRRRARGTRFRARRCDVVTASTREKLTLISQGCWTWRFCPAATAAARHSRGAEPRVVPFRGMVRRGATADISPEVERLLKNRPKPRTRHSSDEETRRIDAECFQLTPYLVAYLFSGLMVRKARCVRCV